MPFDVVHQMAALVVLVWLRGLGGAASTAGEECAVEPPAAGGAALLQQRSILQAGAAHDFPRRSKLGASIEEDGLGSATAPVLPWASIDENGSPIRKHRRGKRAPRPLKDIARAAREKRGQSGRIQEVSSNRTNYTNESEHFNATNASNFTDDLTELSDIDLLLLDTVNQTGLMTAYLNPLEDDLFIIDLAPLINNADLSSEGQIMVTAMAARGNFLDDEGTQVTMHQPLENTENTMLGFKLSANNKTLDVLQPQLSLRTSDHQSDEAFQRGVNSPWRDNLECLDDDSCVGPGGRILIDGFDLISEGFFTADASYDARIVSVKVFPKNVDITVEYLEQGLVTVTYSLVALPKVPMKPRAADSRLGYFDVRFTDMGVHQPTAEETLQEAVDRHVSYIWRYPLGQLPERQIKMYVDPSVPPRWRLSFKEGIEAWNDAFAGIGHPNAVRGVLPGDEDWPSDYDSGDARFSTVAWCPDAQGVYSMGVAKVDPRSGEIIKGDVIFTDGWVHAYIDDLAELTKTESLLNGFRREDLHPEAAGRRAKGVESAGSFAQSAGAAGMSSSHLIEVAHRGRHGEMSMLSVREALSASRRHNETSSELDIEADPVMATVASGLRSVVTHEVGHLLGLRHNFKGSAGVSYECIKSRSCTSVHGTSASVMDYVPMNLPQGGAADVEVFSRVVGAYDKLAIAYGYMEVPPGLMEESPEMQKKLQLILEQAEGFQSCLDEGRVDNDQGDPLCAAHDVSDRPLDWYADRLELIREALARALDVAVKPGKSYANYGGGVLDLLSQAEGIGQTLVTWLGGVNVSMVHRHNDGSPRAARQPIPEALQHQALSLLLMVMRPYKSGLLPSAEQQQFLVVQNKEDVMDLDLKVLVYKIQKYLMGSAMHPHRVKAMYLREEIPSSNKDAAIGLSAASFLDTMASEVLGTDSLNLVTQDSKEWGLHRLLAQSLRALHKSDLPEELAAHVSRHMSEARAAAGRRLRMLEDELRAASLNSTAANDTGDQRQAQTRSEWLERGRDAEVALREAQSEGPALLRQHLLLLRQELKPAFGEDPLYHEAADGLIELGAVEGAARAKLLPFWALVAAALASHF